MGNNYDQTDRKLSFKIGGTGAHHYTLLGSESTYMKEAPKCVSVVRKIAGIDPIMDYHCKPGQILPHLYVKNIFLAKLLAELEHFHWQPS